MLFRKFLMALRKRFGSNQRGYLIATGVGVLIFGAVTLLVDALLPFDGFWNILRSLLLIPTALAVYGFLYGVSLKLHYRQLDTNPEWVPFRLRFSSAWRIRISLLVGALLLVLVYATGQSIGYTFISSILVAIVVAIFAFLRQTREEKRRESLNIPDSRDTKFKEHRRELDAARAAREAERAEIKRRKKSGEVDEDESEISESDR